MTYTEKAKRSIETAVRMLREKPVNSTLVERHFLLYEAWDKYADLPHPLMMGKGLTYVLERASLPVEEYDLLLGRFDDHVPTSDEEVRLQRLWDERAPETNPLVVQNSGHLTLDFEPLIKHGIVGYIERCEARLKKAKLDREEEKAIVFLEGMLLVYKAILDYIKRYADAAEKAGLIDCAAVCDALTKRAPSTFREALQLILFVYNVYLIYAGQSIACINVGRLDNILLPFYENDLANGTTEDELGAYIDDFSAKMSLHLGRGEHQLDRLDENYNYTGWRRNPAFDSPGYITIGGYSNENEQKANPLSILFAKHIHTKLKNPVYICRYTKDTNEELWDIISEKVAGNASVLLYNDETLIPAHLHIGAEKRDAVNYSVHPCNWADMGGGSVEVGSMRVVLPIILNDVLHSGVQLKCMDDIFEATCDRYGELIRPVFAAYREKFSSEPVRDSLLSLDDCFLEGPMKKARGVRCGGVKYPIVYTCLRAIGTATDMLCAIKELVFDKKICTLDALVKIADSDFKDRPGILKLCKNAPKYGTDNAVADEYSVRLMNELLDVIDREATNENGVRDIYTLNVTVCDSNHIYYGAETGGTVDGRLGGTPFSENLSPTVGAANGVTALLNSASKLPFDRIHSGVLNIRLSKSAVRGENAAAHIKALIKSYFDNGGMQLQFSIADTDELKKAQVCPDEYRDLLVRITGYSAVFVDISKPGQDEFIRREEM